MMHRSQSELPAAKGADYNPNDTACRRSETGDPLALDTLAQRHIGFDVALTVQYLDGKILPPERGMH